jgi:hypothetical protein
MKWFLLAVGMLVAASSQVTASKPVANRPYVQSGAEGVFYARCVPADDAGPAGTTKVYKAGHEKDELIDSYDWYAPGGVTLGWSPTAGRVAAMARGSEPGSELSFYLGGRKLASYTVEDLGKLGVELAKRRSTAGPEVRAEFRVVGCEQVPGTNGYDFVIESKGKRLAFDVVTGRPRAK